MNIGILLVLGGLILAASILFLVMRKRQSGEEDKSADPLAEAEVYLGYGRKNEAKKILEEHLRSHPDDARAISLLNKAGD